MARTLRLCAVAGLAISAHWAAPAWAAGAMATGGLTSQPIGHYDFCKSHPAECNIHPANLAPAKMTDGLWRKLTGVSAKVTAQQRYLCFEHDLSENQFPLFGIMLWAAVETDLLHNRRCWGWCG